MVARFQSSTEHRLLDPKQARSIAGVLALLIAVVGPRSSLGIILQQARSEVLSLLHSQEEEDFRQRPCHAA
ncbi:MAG TPA: hypothetical protein VGZ47_23755 [Gemmataceae bacterium]|jgi:hypothetical protein|nr:hypothetical protein [Gemmataceae bacterium]